MVLLLLVLHRTRRHPSRRVRLLARDHAQHSKRQRCIAVRSLGGNLERTVGIEPTSKAWKLSYYRCTTPAHSLECSNERTASKIVSLGHQSQHCKKQRCIAFRSLGGNLERTVGIEPTSKAWKLSYYRCTTPAHSLACLNQPTASKIVSPGHQLRRLRMPSPEEKKHRADSHQHQEERGWFGRHHHELLYLTTVCKGTSVSSVSENFEVRWIDGCVTRCRQGQPICYCDLIAVRKSKRPR